MFRDKEIIAKLDAVLQSFKDYSVGPVINRTERKIDDIEEYCRDIEQKLNSIEENCLRDDEEFRFQIRLAVKEYMVDQIPKEKKKPKKGNLIKITKVKK